MAMIFISVVSYSPYELADIYITGSSDYPIWDTVIIT